MTFPMPTLADSPTTLISRGAFSRLLQLATHTANKQRPLPSPSAFTPGRTAGGRLQPWCTQLQIPCVLAEDPLALPEHVVPDDLECLGSSLSHHCNLLSKQAVVMSASCKILCHCGPGRTLMFLENVRRAYPERRSGTKRRRRAP